VGVKTVWRWRKALGVTRTNNPGTMALMRQASEKGASQLRGKQLSEEQVERRRRAALELNLGRMLIPGYHGPRWADEELRLSGTMQDGSRTKPFWCLETCTRGTPAAFARAGTLLR
jgi:hypothetical protein